MDTICLPGPPSLQAQTQPGDDNGLTQRWLHQSDALQGNGAQHRKSGGVILNIFGYCGTEILRHADDLGVRPI